MEYFDFFPQLIADTISEMTFGRLLVIVSIILLIDYFLKKYSPDYRAKTHVLRKTIFFLELISYGFHITIYFLSYSRADKLINELFVGKLNEVYIGEVSMQVIAINILLFAVTLGCRWTAVLILSKFTEKEDEEDPIHSHKRFFNKRNVLVRGVVLVLLTFFYLFSLWLSVPGAAQRRVENIREVPLLTASDSTEYRTLVKQMASIEKQEEVIRKRQEQAMRSLQEAQREVENANNPASKKVAQYMLRLKQEQSPKEEAAITTSFALIDKQKQQFQQRYDKEMNRLRDLYDQRAKERSVREKEEAQDGKRTARGLELGLILIIIFITILKGKVNHIVLANYQNVILEEERAKVIRTTDKKKSVSSAAKPKALGTGLKYDKELSSLNPKYTAILKELDNLSFLDKIESRFWDTPKMICELVEYEYNNVMGNEQPKSMNRIIDDAEFPKTTGKTMFYKRIQGKVTPKTQRIGNSDESETKSKIKITKEEDSDFDSKDKNITLQDKLKDVATNATKNAKEATRSRLNSFYTKLNRLKNRKSNKVNETESRESEST